MLSNRLQAAGRHSPRAVAVRSSSSGGLAKPSRPEWADPAKRAGMSPMLPKLVAFDLDGTLWYPEMYMLNGGAPFRRDKTGAVFDKLGEQVELIGASRAILTELGTDPRWKETHVAMVSRTEYPEWAIPCMQMFQLAPDLTMYSVAQHHEIFPGSKTTHFKNIHKRTGIAYEDMLFFDNERWNCTDCAPLGITCIYTPRGMTEGAWTQGLQEFVKNKSKAKK